jgi:hypothetical protein
MDRNPRWAEPWSGPNPIAIEIIVLHLQYPLSSCFLYEPLIYASMAIVYTTTQTVNFNPTTATFLLFVSTPFFDLNKKLTFPVSTVLCSLIKLVALNKA